MKRNVARMVHSIVVIPEAITCLLTLGFYNPAWSVKVVIHFAKIGWYGK